MSTTAVKKTCDRCGDSLEFSSWHYADVSLCGECNGKRIAQPRFDWEAEEQRTNDLEDLVLQLVERVEKLEQAWRDINSTKKDNSFEMDLAGNYKPRIPTERELNKADKELLELELSGQQTAKAIKAME